MQDCRFFVMNLSNKLPFTIVAYVHRQLLHKKKDVVYGLLFCYYLAGLESQNLLETHLLLTQLCSCVC